MVSAEVEVPADGGLNPPKIPKIKGVYFLDTLFGAHDLSVF